MKVYKVILAIAAATVMAGLLIFTTNVAFGVAPRVGLASQGSTGTSTTPVAGEILMSFADNSYGPTALIAGTDITISTSTYRRVTISSNAVPASRSLTIAGTANQITSSAGAQDLSADRTWTLSLPNLVIFPIAASSTRLSIFDTAYFGATATSSFSSAGMLTLASALTVGNGGTGATSLAGLLQGNGTSAFTTITGTAGQFPYYNGTNTLLATSSIFILANGRIGIASTTPNYTLSLGDFPVAGTSLGTTTAPKSGYTQPITFVATTTVNGSKTYNWVQESGGPTFTTPPSVVISADYTQDAVTLLQCNPSSRTTTTVVIACVSIADGLTAVVQNDATNRVINVIISGY